jgi:DNA-binding transcriptional ArsR family regulator|tara:strand:+ start:291 stop:887 length:597 start_codon:yes stop_codon:yes gene_type:complete
MVNVVEQIELLIVKEAKRLNQDRDKLSDEQFSKCTREQKDVYKEKLSKAIQEHRDQQKKHMKEINERQREQINSLKHEHRSIITNLQRENYDYVCKVAEKVSNLYRIPIKTVRRDLAPEDDTRCMGLKKNGKLCTNKAVRDGFCCIHLGDIRPSTPVCVPTGNIRHNHPFPSGFILGCPACEKDKMIANEFREIPSIM